MDSLIKADIFFFITTIAIFVLRVLFAVLLFYAISFMRNMQKASEDIKEEIDAILVMVKNTREMVQEKGAVLGTLANTFLPKQKVKVTRKKSASKKNETNEEVNN